MCVCVCVCVCVCERERERERERESFRIPEESLNLENHGHDNKEHSDMYHQLPSINVPVSEMTRPGKAGE